MDVAIKLYSSTDLNSYTPSYELLFGNLKITNEFQKLATVGDGSSGSVSKARDKHGNIIALKRLKQSSGCFEKEVFREINILKSLDHDNIVKLIDIATSADLNLYLILEYCPYPLDRYIDCFREAGRDISHDQVKSVTKQMFLGINYLHQNYIVHRDIKPSNLMISGTGILKIIDFGLSRRVIQYGEPMTPHRMTCWYQPPEILFEAPKYGFEVDLWSAGCVLAELLKREPLLPGRSDIDQINLIVNLIGKPSARIWPEMTECKALRSINLKDQPFNNLSKRFPELGSTEAMDLMSSLIVYNPKQRLSAEACAYHDWLEQAPLPAKTIAIPKELTEDAPPAPMIETSEQKPPR